MKYHVFLIRSNDDIVEICSDFMVSDISFEDTENFGLSLHIFMRFSWVDNRLEVNRKAEGSQNQIVTVNPKFMENIWVPDLFIYELQSFKRLELVKDISAGLKFIIHKNNDIGMKGQQNCNAMY